MSVHLDTAATKKAVMHACKYPGKEVIGRLPPQHQESWSERSMAQPTRSPMSTH
jgi:hypothetical protein